MKEKITVPQIHLMKQKGEKIVMLTAYDWLTARIIDEAGIDIILVGDSLGTVIAGYETTLPVTLDEVIYHTRAVARGRKRALLVADMPFLSYQSSIRDAKISVGRLIKEGYAEAVKLEGGKNMVDTIKAIVDMDIPVMGHVGLTPQSVHRMGGYKVQGRNEKQREKIVEDAIAVEEAGVFSVVLEGIPSDLAATITKTLKIPTIGIGAGVHCDGQVLVIHDLLGITFPPRPKFVKAYLNGAEIIHKAVKEFIEEVKTGRFPDEEHSYH